MNWLTDSQRFSLNICLKIKFQHTLIMCRHTRTRGFPEGAYFGSGQFTYLSGLLSGDELNDIISHVCTS